MNTSNTPASPDAFERGTTAAEAESVQAEQPDNTEKINSPQLALIATTLAALAIGAGVLLQNPDIHKTCRSVLEDRKVRDVCRDAAVKVYREIAASWSRHGGPAALAGALVR